MNRPGFQKMLRAIEAGYISAVFVKDLSRLGRNYIEVGKLDVYKRQSYRFSRLYHRQFETAGYGAGDKRKGNGIYAVSYTHLDVYKRQSPCFHSLMLPKCFLPPPARPNTSTLYWLSASFTAYRVSPYTDVYKRQGEGRCQNKKDNPEKLQIVIITRKRIVSSSVWSNDTTLSLVF